MKRSTVVILGCVAGVVLGGGTAFLTNAPPVFHRIEVERVTFSGAHPSDGWLVGQTHPRSPSILYRTTDGGRQWHQVRRLPFLGYSNLLAGRGAIWIPIQTATHSLRRSLALAYSRKPYVQWSSQPLIATTRSVPWTHYIAIVTPQRTSKAPWLLAESQWNTEGLFTLFHYEPKRRHWTAVHLPWDYGEGTRHALVEQWGKRRSLCTIGPRNGCTPSCASAGRNLAGIADEKCLCIRWHDPDRPSYRRAGVSGTARTHHGVLDGMPKR